MKKKFLLPRSTSGQSLVELAVSLVILLYLLSGAAEFGILFFQYIQLRDAAQEGALYGSIQQVKNETDIENRVRASSSSPINMSIFDRNDIDFVVKDPSGTVKTLATACEGDGLTVIVEFTHDIMLPFIPRDEIVLSATVTDTILLSDPALVTAGTCPH